MATAKEPKQDDRPTVAQEFLKERGKDSNF